MTLQEFAQHLVRVAFLVMAGLTFLDYLRRPNRTRLDISLLFGCFVPSLLLQALPESARASLPWASSLGSLAILAHPYLLLRLVHRLRQVPRAIRVVGVGGMLVSWALLLAYGSPLPAAATLAIVVYFGVVEGYAALSLLRGGARRRGLARRRLQLAAAGSGWLALAILLAGAAVVLPAAGAVIGPAVQGLAVLSVFSYYAGFTPPRGLRRFWQFGELYEFMRAGASRSAEARLDQLLDSLCPAAVRAVGGLGGIVWLETPDGGPKLRKADFPIRDSHALSRVEESLGRVDSIHAGMKTVSEWKGGLLRTIAGPLGASWVEIVPIAEPSQTWGALMVFLPHESLFPEDDLELLALLAEQTAGALAAAELFREQRALATRLEQLNADLGREVFERQRAEEEIRGLNRDLEGRIRERESAFEELESFSYSVSHDLRAPLRTIHGFARILLDEHASGLAPESERYLRLIDAGARQLGTLIDELLTFSQLGRQNLQKRKVDTEEVVRQTVDHLQREDPDRRMSFTLGELPVCEADPTMIRSVWSNLLSNAVKFTRRKAQARIEIGARPSPGGPVYFVRDNGVGFDMRYADKLFGVFQRLHRAEDFEGTGVGLAIVQRVVERHGGRVWAESKDGEGAAFFFTLGGSDGRSDSGN